jgi:hypothetical protein
MAPNNITIVPPPPAATLLNKNKNNDPNDSDSDYELDEDFLSNLGAEVVRGSIVNPERRISRGSLVWFQKETTEHVGLIGHDGKLRDEYVTSTLSSGKASTSLWRP